MSVPHPPQVHLPLTQREREELDNLRKEISDLRQIVEKTPLSEIVSAVANRRMWHAVNYTEVRR